MKRLPKSFLMERGKKRTGRKKAGMVLLIAALVFSLHPGTVLAAEAHVGVKAQNTEVQNTEVLNTEAQSTEIQESEAQNGAIDFSGAEQLYEEYVDKLTDSVETAINEQVVEPAKEAAKEAVRNRVQNFWQDLKSSVVSFFQNIFSQRGE